MRQCSHITNSNASGFVRTFRNDRSAYFAHKLRMARRGIPNQINWYLREWMDMLGVNQSEMIRRTDWSKASMSQLYNNKQDYSPKLVNEAALALKVATYELLMKPETAMAMRRLRQDAMRVVADSNALEESAPEEPATEQAARRRKSG